MNCVVLQRLFFPGAIQNIPAAQEIRAASDAAVDALSAAIAAAIAPSAVAASTLLQPYLLLLLLVNLETSEELRLS